MYVATTWTEGIKSFYMDTSNTTKTPPTTGLIRYDVLFSLVASNTKDTVHVGYLRGSTWYYPKFTFSRIGNNANELVLARGRVVWDSVSSTNKQVYTWGLVLGKPLR
jgi:hypothetical protein